MSGLAWVGISLGVIGFVGMALLVYAICTVSGNISEHERQQEQEAAWDMLRRAAEAQKSDVRNRAR